MYKSEILSYFDVKRYIVLLFDEMKVMINFVLDKMIGELIGFIDFGDLELNFVVLEKVDIIVLYVFEFFVWEMCIKFKFGLVYFVIIGIIVV